MNVFQVSPLIERLRSLIFPLVPPLVIPTCRLGVGKIRAAFQMLDHNQDGKVNAEELKRMLTHLGIECTDGKVEEILTKLSKSGNGFVSEADFLQWMSSMVVSSSRSGSGGSTSSQDDIVQDLIHAFRVFDKDQNGFITKDELVRAMEMMGERVTEQEVATMLDMADIDKDGQIDYQGSLRR
ncbi:unnamed protein product [Cyprideis torosa]|uniref:Uncharacterized protein n=1 Tax=Cyprideis torosa TaxID=163714 RepID=A0A7R8WIE1_9CRUS|nr:unnamed protein product [Cyprideis torosa]CAG0897789.1 unnamed protein product [Cyprideis torosa]